MAEPLVRVARARHQAEAEMLEQILRDEGIPVLVRRTRGFDVPDFMASGPRDILVPASAAMTAREALGVPVPDPEPPRSTVHGTPPWVRTLAVVLVIVALVLVAAFAIVAIGS